MLHLRDSHSLRLLLLLLLIGVKKEEKSKINKKASSKKSRQFDITNALRWRDLN